MVERGIEPTQPPRDIIEDYSIPALYTEISMLRGKIKNLEETRTKEVEYRQPEPLNKQVVDLLRSGGSWPSTRIIKELGTDHAASINNTLEQLYSLELIKRDWRGWAWTK